MWEMRHVNIGDGSLSKGTQSDGLISDTSTEELASGSSAGNLKEGHTLEKFVAKNSKEICNEPRKPTDFVLSKSLQMSFHQIQNPSQLYVKWGVLLSLGVLLWVALWLTDILTPNPFSKEGWLADLATAKKVTLEAGVAKKADPPAWWFHNLWSYAWNSIISVTTLEILMVLSCVTIFIYFESHGRNKWDEINERLYYEMEQSETDSNSFHSDNLEDSTPKEPGNKSWNNSSLKLSHSDVRNLMTQDILEGKSELSVEGAKCQSQKEKTSVKTCISSSPKNFCRVHNIKNRSVHFNDIKNGSSLSRRISCIDRPRGAASSELIFDKPKLNLSCTSCMPKRDKKKANDAQSTFSCAIINKSTSFKSEKIETWFKLSNSDRAEKVMHSFDSELEDLFKTRNYSLPTSFGEQTQHLQRFYNNNISCECGGQSKTLIFNLDCNRGIISSSPAFQKFLMNLGKDAKYEPYL